MLYIANQIVTICGLILIVFILNYAGYLEQIVRFILRISGKNTKYLTGIIILITIFFSLIVSNYLAVLILFPLILKLRKKLSLTRPIILSYLLIIGFMADTTSLVNNAINTITKEYFNLSNLRFLLVIIPLNILVIFSSIAVVWFYFRRYLPKELDTENLTILEVTFPDQRIFYLLSVLIFNNFFPQFSSLITVTVGIILLTITPKLKRKFSLVKHIPWGIIGLIFSIYGIGISFGRIGLIELMAGIFVNLSQWGITFASISTGILASLESILLTNFVAITNNNLAINQAEITDLTIKETMIYANLIGCIIGAKITPLGSLSTLLWYGNLKKWQLGLHWFRYLMINFALTLPVLFISLLCLAIWLPWLIV